MATIYLDNAATTKPFKEAVAFAANFLDEDFYNPSALYSEGLKVKSCVEDARKAVSRAFGGNFGLLMSNFIDNAKLSKNDLEELYDMLKQAEEGL